MLSKFESIRKWWAVEKMKNDAFAAERAVLEKCGSDIVFMRKVVGKFEEAISSLNPMHQEFETHAVGFFEGDSLATRKSHVVALARSTENVELAYEDAKAEYVTLKVNLDKMHEEVKSMLTRLRERDRAAMKHRHYDEKVNQLKSQSNSTPMASMKLDRNQKKLALAQGAFLVLDGPVVAECRKWMDTRFEAMELILQSYVALLDKYFGGVHARFSALALETPNIAGLTTSMKKMPIEELPAEIPVSTENVVAATPLPF